MATSPPPSSSTSPPQPSPSATSPPPLSSSSPPPQSQPNDNSASPPPSSSATPPPASSSAPPPATPPPATPVTPPPSTPSAPSPTTPPFPPPAAAVPSPPASNSPPPSPTLTPPPPDSSPPPTTPATSPPPAARPPSPGKANPQPSPTAKPPTSSSPPPPSAKPPAVSPPSPPPPPPPNTPPPTTPPTKTPSTPAPKNEPPGVPSPPSPPPTNSSSGLLIPSSPSSPPRSMSPTTPSGNAGGPPSSPTGNETSNLNPNVNNGVPRGNSSPSGGGGINAGTTVAIGLISTVVLLGLVGLVVFLVRKRRKPTNGYAAGYVMPSPYASSQMSDTSYPRSPTGRLIHLSSVSHGYEYSPSDLGNSKSWFTYEELSAATDGFSTRNLLGEGGFGCVYKGRLQDGRDVAVKQLKAGGGQGEREFRAEVEIISRIHHRHLVSLVGYCIQDSQRLLVYDYVPNGTLHYHLLGQGRPVMDWATRVRVAVGAARGLAYLHEDCHPRIIHRDIKSSNILLDSNYEAQVADFGLARLAMDALTHVTTRVMGTFGYLAPEYALSGKLTDKSDVYSYGVVLLELITGRKPVDDSQPLGDESLVEWARPLLGNALESRDFGDLPDPRLENNYDEREMFRMIEAAAACVRHSATMRPRMGQVVRALESFSDVDMNNGIIPGQSELFAPQSSEIRLFQRMAFGSQNFSTDFSQASWIQSRNQSHSQSRNQSHSQSHL